MAAVGSRARGPAGRALIVEDSPDIQHLIRTILHRAGYEVNCAENGQIACQAVRKAVQIGCPLDFILMDIEMPIMDGLTATRTLRSEGIRTPIIAVTARTQDEHRRESFEAGVDEHLEKPIDRNLLLATVRSLAPVPDNPAGPAAAT